MDTLDFPLQIKSVAESGRIEGIISTFGGLDTHGDTIEPGAYTKSLARLDQAGRKLPVLYQHDLRRPIGVWTELRQTAYGLHGKADLVLDVPDARAAHALAKAGALTGISIGYDIPPGGARFDRERRILSDIDLHEASLVTMPSDNGARISSVKAIVSPADIEDLLRAGGLSGRQAKAAASAAWRTIHDSKNDETQADAELAALIRESTARLTARN